MEERVDILDANGKPTGRQALKSEAHQQGWFHPTVHIWFYTPDGRVLLQQRGKGKDTHPLLWDVSVAGHVMAGEAIASAAVRETREEIGLDIAEADLEPLGIFKSEQLHGPGLIDREYHHCYLCPLRVPLGSLRKQDSEVEQLGLIPLIQFAEEIFGLANPGKYVPHGIPYYKAVIRALRERL